MDESRTSLLKKTAIIKRVLPKGDILNDGGTDVDRLGHVIYASALALQIQRIKTPVTVGIFAPWGSGKSFLLKHVQSLAANEQERHKKKTSNKKRKKKKLKTKACTWVCPGLVLFLLLLFTSLTVIFSTAYRAASLFIIFLILSIVLLSLLLLIVLGSGENCFDYGWFKYKWVLLSAMYTKLPIGEEEIPTVQTTTQEKIILKKKETDDTSKFQSTRTSRSGSERGSDESTCKSRRFIFVNFNAWEYAGCDKLWAGIVTTLANKIEEEFGVFTTRVFRTLFLDIVAKDHHLADSCKLRVKVKDCSEETLHELMTNHGEVISCVIIGQYNSTGNVENEFEITFSTSREAKIAFKALKHIRVNVELLPTSSYSQTNFENDGFDMWKQLIYLPRRSCLVPDWIWCILFTVACILVPAVTFSSIHTTKNFEQTFKNVTQQPDDDDERDDVSEIIGQILSCLPFGASLLFILFRIVWAFFNSQKRRIVKSLKGVKGQIGDELGFMNKVKEEVQAITNLIHTVEFTTNVEFKVIIMIDDLDRVPLPKVKAVLEAVNILLSERFSPFICLIAIDSRVAVKCFEIEVENDETMQDRNGIINGFEYLKKIINVPFCLPEIDFDSKTCFIAGLIDEADETEEHLEELYHPTKKSNDKHQLPKQEMQRNMISDERIQQHPPGQASISNSTQRMEKEVTGDLVESDEEAFTETNIPDFPSNMNDPVCSTAVQKSLGSKEEEIECQPILCQTSFNDFLFECRKYMYEDKTLKHHIHGNPRNIKRIFNVISITASVIHCLQKRKSNCRQWSVLANETRNQSSTGGCQTESTHARGNETSKQRKVLNAADVVLWVVLTDQWPFHMSYLIQVIEDSDQRAEAGREGEGIPNGTNLFEIYKKTMEKIKHTSESIQQLKTLDYDPDLLYSLLLNNKEFTKQKVKELLKYSINLDRNLRRTISFETDKLDLQQTDKRNRQQLEPPFSETKVDSALSNQKIEADSSSFDAKPPPTLAHRMSAGTVLLTQKF